MGYQFVIWSLPTWEKHTLAKERCRNQTAKKAFIATHTMIYDEAGGFIVITQDTVPLLIRQYMQGSKHSNVVKCSWNF